MKIALALGLIVATFAACSGRRLPPGTPPPEYEPPQVIPWSPEGNDAGTDASPPGTGEHTDAAASPAAESELSLDAGPR
ncbi:MAG TPA: hypothetical protein VER96_33180 [Polyangiaceae bacterium]|nr:hypothetical protein [Polyangiaceae bacterium]